MVDRMEAKVPKLRLSQIDRDILGLLKQDSRRTISEMAAVLKTSRASIRTRMELLREKGVIQRFTIEIADQQKQEPVCMQAFFQIRLKRHVCHIVYASISGWPEIIGCWSIAGDLDMIVLVSAVSYPEIERLRDKLARHPEVKTLCTLSVLRDWAAEGNLPHTIMPHVLAS